MGRAPRATLRGPGPAASVAASARDRIVSTVAAAAVGGTLRGLGAAIMRSSVAVVPVSVANPRTSDSMRSHSGGFGAMASAAAESRSNATSAADGFGGRHMRMAMGIVNSQMFTAPSPTTRMPSAGMVVRSIATLWSCWTAIR